MSMHVFPHCTSAMCVPCSLCVCVCAVSLLAFVQDKTALWVEIKMMIVSVAIQRRKEKSGGSKGSGGGWEAK